MYGFSSVPTCTSSGYANVWITGSLVSTSPSISLLLVVILFIKYCAPAFFTICPVLVSLLFTCKNAVICGSVITFSSNGSLLSSLTSMKNGLDSSNPVITSPSTCTSSALSISITTYLPYDNSSDIASPFLSVNNSDTGLPFESVSNVTASASSGISY